MLLESYTEQFDPLEMKMIRSIGPSLRNDSTFILCIMRYLYKGEEFKKLEHRGATGRKYMGRNKHEITFEKKEIMTKMLTERISDEMSNQPHNFSEFSKRMGRFYSLIRFAIRNILVAHQKNQNKVKYFIIIYLTRYIAIYGNYAKYSTKFSFFFSISH